MLSSPVNPREPASHPTFFAIRAISGLSTVAPAERKGAEGEMASDLATGTERMARGVDAPIAPDKSAARVWALLGPRRGDNNQVLALAEALGLTFEVKQLAYNNWRHLRPGLLGERLLSLTAQSRRAIDGPPPELIISTGIRAVPVARAIRRRSQGRTKLVHLGAPRVPVAHFDLVVPTPEYDVEDAPNVVRIPVALTRADHPQQDGEPTTLISIGGDTLYWRLHPRDLLDQLDRLGDSMIVALSARTGPDLARMLRDRSFRLIEADDGAGYRRALLCAERIFVTADSVAMISDAVARGRFAGMIPLRPSALGRVMMALNDALRPGRRLRPRDMRFFWKALGDSPAGQPIDPKSRIRDLVLKLLQ